MIKRSSALFSGNVGVEKEQIDAADLQLPDFGEDVAIQNAHRDKKIRAVALDFAKRQMMKILIETDRLLRAVLVDLLPEIAVAIKQADCDEVQVEIARRLAMVAGQNAKAAGIIWNRFVKSELGRKIRHGFLDRGGGSGFSVGVLAGEIISKRVINLFELAQESLVLGQFFQARLSRQLQHPHRIVVCSVPKIGIEMAEKPPGRWFPGPPKVERNFPQRLERCREVWESHYKFETSAWAAAKGEVGENFLNRQVSPG